MALQPKGVRFPRILLPVRQPVYGHDCEACVYLGTTVDGHERPIDLYAHGDDCEGGANVVARCSSEGPDYHSEMLWRDRYPLSLAYELAVERGVIGAQA